jgi:hypothetical protein
MLPLPDGTGRNGGRQRALKSLTPRFGPSWFDILSASH